MIEPGARGLQPGQWPLGWRLKHSRGRLDATAFGGAFMTRFSRRDFVTTATLSVPLLASSSLASAQVSETVQGGDSDVERIVIDAYIYGYSLITTEVTRVQMSNVPAPEGLHAPM